MRRCNDSAEIITLSNEIAVIESKMIINNIGQHSCEHSVLQKQHRLLLSPDAIKIIIECDYCKYYIDVDRIDTNKKKEKKRKI